MATISPGIPTPLLQLIQGGACSTGAGNNSAQTVKAIAQSRPIIVGRNASTGILEPRDAYSRGVIQGLQRSLVAYGANNNIILEIDVDGRMGTCTVTYTIAVLKVIGLPRGVDSMPTTDNDIVLDCRFYAEHIAKASGVESNFIPSDAKILSSSLSVAATAPKPPAPLFSKRNMTLGAVVVGGFFLLNR